MSLNCCTGVTDRTDHRSAGWSRQGTIKVQCQCFTLSCWSNVNDFVLRCEFDAWSTCGPSQLICFQRPLHAACMYLIAPKFGCPIFYSNEIIVKRWARERLLESRWTHRPWCEYPKIFMHLGSACDNHNAVSTLCSCF